MDYYPVFLDLRGRPVLLVGGGRVAAEKVGRLAAAGAKITVIAPEITAAISAAVDAGSATWVSRPFAAGDTAGMFVVVIATDDGAVNRTVAADARASGALVNAADDAANCDFILPAVVERGRVTLAASTGGTSPAMARYLRGRMDEWLTTEVAALADVAADARLEARRRETACAGRCPRVGTPPPLCCLDCPNRIPSDRWQAALGEETLAALRAGGPDAAAQRMHGLLGLDGPLVEVPWWREDPA